MGNIFTKIKEDAYSQNYRPVPWEASGAHFNVTKLPKSKHMCSDEEMLEAAQTAIRLTETNNPYVLYTDGSVDTTTETAGSAVHSSRFTAGWRITNGASTMQTELVAILEALRYTADNESGPVVIHCDSLAALQALQANKIKENKNLLSQVHTLIKQHKDQNRKVTLNWIPSHIGIHGNEEADRLAKQTNQIADVQINVQPSLQQLKNQTRHISKKSMTDNINFWVGHNSRSAKWYNKATKLEPPPVDKHTPRELAVIIHRLRLGYKANWQIIAGVNRPCEHCENDTNEPLLHYLLECQHTRTLRNNISVPSDIHADASTDTACSIVKQITDNLEYHSNTLITYPPPR